MPTSTLTDLSILAGVAIANFICFPKYHAPYTVGTLLVALVYYLVVRKRDPHLAEEISFRWSPEISRQLVMVLLLLVPGIVWSVTRLGGSENRLWLVLPLYLVWGVMQQFLVQWLGVRHLARWLGNRATVVVAALLFGGVHMPGGPLFVGLTALFGAATVAWYLKYRKIVPIGMVHGFLAPIYYAWNRVTFGL